MQKTPFLMRSWLSFPYEKNPTAMKNFVEHRWWGKLILMAIDGALIIGAISLFVPA